MSQSDYLNHKRNAQVLENQSILESVLESQQLTNFKTYSISKQIDNDKIFDMKLKTSGCPSFIFCINTNTRINRKLNNIIDSNNPDCSSLLFSNYKKMSKNGYYLYLKKRGELCPAKEMQACDEYLYLRRHRNKITDLDNANDKNHIEEFTGDRL
jgi:uncharacterized protein YcgL (UPF0745 family)